jgi:hypothetical protein
MTNTVQVLHLVLLSLKPDAGPEARARLIAGWSSLREIPGVSHLGAIPQGAGGSHTMALYALLPDLTAIERFGTDSRHMTFLRDQFIPVLQSFAGADLFAEAPPPRDAGSALCFLLRTGAGVYDWQTRDALAALLAESGAIGLSAGVAINAKQRYQAGGLLCFADAGAAAAYAESERFQRLRAQRWRDLAADVALVWGACHALPG